MLSELLTVDVLVGIFASGIRLATSYLYAAIGETFGQLSGVLNLGVDGIMLMGAFGAYYIVIKTGDLPPSVSLLLGVLTLSDAYLPVDAVYLSRQFLRDPGKLASLNRTLEREPRFRREFRRLRKLDGGALLFLR